MIWEHINFTSQVGFFLLYLEYNYWYILTIQYWTYWMCVLIGLIKLPLHLALNLSNIRLTGASDGAHDQALSNRWRH